MRRISSACRFLALFLAVVSHGALASAAWAPKVVVGTHYPRLAQLARIQDTVVVDVVIDAAGKPTRVGAVSGHPLLRDAVVASVKLWGLREVRRRRERAHHKIDFRLPYRRRSMQKPMLRRQIRLQLPRSDRGDRIDPTDYAEQVRYNEPLGSAAKLTARTPPYYALIKFKYFFGSAVNPGKICFNASFF